MKKLTITTLIIALCMCLALPVLAAGEDSAGASPDGEPITVYATVAVAGEFAEDADGAPVMGAAVDVSDEDGDGAITLNDAFTAIHASLCPDGVDAYASYEGDYGLSVAKFWGDESGAFGYYINNVSALSAGDPVSDGDAITAFVYSDAVNYSDMYTWFETSEITAVPGETVSLKLNTYTFDESWNAVESACENAAISVLDADGNETDIAASLEEDGSVTVTFNDTGDFTVIAKTDETPIVPSFCTVSVEEDTSEGGTSDNGSSTSGDSSDTASSEAGTDSESAAEDEENGLIYILIWSTLGIGIVAIVVNRIVKKIRQ